MLDLIPLAGPGRQMAHEHLEVGFIHQRLQLILPEPDAVSVAAPAVRANQKTLGLRILFVANGAPPAVHTGHRKAGGIMIAPHIDPSLVAGQIVDPGGDGLGFVRMNKVINVDLLRFPLLPPLAAFIEITANEFFLLGVHRDHGIAPPQEAPNLTVEVLKLPVAIGMVGAFLQRLEIGLQAVTHLGQQPAYSIGTDPMAFLGQGLRQLAGALARPQQGRHRIPARAGLYQLLQSLKNLRILGNNPPPPAATLPHLLPRRSRLGMLKLFQRPVNRAARHSRGLCYRRYTTVSQRPRLQSSSQAKLPLIEMRHQGQQPILKPFCAGHIPRLHYCRNLSKLFCGVSLAKEIESLRGQKQWMESTIIEIVISEAQNEPRDFAKWGFD